VGNQIPRNDSFKGGVSIENLLNFQEELASKYKYRKLKQSLSTEVRQKYLDNLTIRIKYKW